MAVLQAILLLALRSISRLLQTAFGWAILLLFGRVPRQRRVTLNLMLVISVVWLICVIGVLLPNLAVFLLAFAPLLKLWKMTLLRRCLCPAVLNSYSCSPTRLIFSPL
jgi:hypothetical protein